MSEVTLAAAPVDEMKDPIRIDCKVVDRKPGYILYKRHGWTFKDFRLWEISPTSQLVALVCSKMIGWELYDDAGNAIPFDVLDKHGKVKAEAFDALDPALSAWVVTSFRLAYSEAGMPHPNS